LSKKGICRKSLPPFCVLFNFRNQAAYLPQIVSVHSSRPSVSAAQMLDTISCEIGAACPSLFLPCIFRPVFLFHHPAPVVLGLIAIAINRLLIDDFANQNLIPPTIGIAPIAVYQLHARRHNQIGTFCNPSFQWFGRTFEIAARVVRPLIFWLT